MTICNHANKVHGCEWKCYAIIKKPKKRAFPCHTVVSIAKHSWFDNTKLKVVEVLELLYEWWSRYFFYISWWLSVYISHLTCRKELKTISQDTGLAPHSTVDWSSFCRQVCIDAVTTDFQPIGGVGKIVEIDESLFGKLKYGRGERKNRGQWVFGGVERDTGNCFLVPVETRNAATLLPIIFKYILPGTTIYSDKWAAYNRLRYIFYID